VPHNNHRPIRENRKYNSGSEASYLRATDSIIDACNITNAKNKHQHMEPHT
jgi:hypothetical protein